MENLLTVEDVQEIVGVPRSTAYEYMRSMTHLKIGKYLRVTRQSLMLWLQHREQEGIECSTSSMQAAKIAATLDRTMTEEGDPSSAEGVAPLRGSASRTLASTGEAQRSGRESSARVARRSASPRVAGTSARPSPRSTHSSGMLPTPPNAQ